MTMSTTKDIEAASLALWFIEGIESGDSFGGDTRVWVLTDGPTDLPDANAAIDQASGGKASFDVIDWVKLAYCYGSLDGTHSTPGDHEWDRYPVVNQTSHDIPGPILEALWQEAQMATLRNVCRAA
jgi:hypothetical protein